MNNVVDLRSDTVTRPTQAMRQAMYEAEVGDDVYGEDPTVLELEQIAADIVGMEAGLFVSSGTQGNLLALLSHCGRGDEFIAGQAAHTYIAEGGGGAICGGIQSQPIDNEEDGTLDLDSVRKRIKPDDFHFAKTRLLCLEDTFKGRALPLNYLEDARLLASEHSLAFHLDGARVFNAATYQSVAPVSITGKFDSVSFCLSKGLGTPIGSVLCSNVEKIKSARRWRKVIGGGWRQAGVLAAAGIYALKHNIQRLSEDHGNAGLLANGLSDIEEVYVNWPAVQTNMVYISVSDTALPNLQDYLFKKGILIEGNNPIRLVTHLDVDEKGIHSAVAAFKSFFQAHHAT